MSDATVDIRPLHVLVVEDDDDHAEIILHVLERHHSAHTTFRVSDGAAALAYLNGEGGYAGQQRPDVILLDLKLPKVNGLEVLARIKEDASLRTIPVVILTTSAASSDRARAYRYHANSYIVKPVSYATFGALVQELSTYWGGWNQGL